MNTLESFVQNDSELRSVFQEGGNGRMQERDNLRNATKKNAFLNNLIHIKLLDPEGNLLDGCEWKVVRKRISLEKIMSMIRRSPLPETEIEFFYDETGVPIWMEDLLLKAQPTPSFYTIVPQVKRFPSDVRTDPKYEGQTIFMITQVPVKAKDEMTVVDQITMREWLMAALLEEDPYSKPLQAKLQPVRDLIKEIDKKIKGIAKIVFYDDDGKVMAEDKAEIEREAVYNAFGEDRLQAELRLKKYENNLEAHMLWRKSLGMDFTMADIDENTSTATWYVRFYGTKDALEMENLLIEKNNWSGINLACWSPGPPKIPAWAGRGQVPNGSNPLIPDYTGLQVNVAGARFLRVPHGVGAIKRLDRMSSTIASERFGIYYGHFELGQKTGNAMEMDDISAFLGKYVRGLRRGPGRIDYGDGTTVVGEFTVNAQVQNKTSLQFDNPYMEGEPNGEHVEILFGDGAMYRGNVRDGRICGKGEYQSAFGEIIIGDFVDGVLHGKNGYRRNHSGEMFKGEWDMGELHGYGIYKNDRGDTYEGYWEHSLRHGRGDAKYNKIGRYRGYFVNGARNGKGELEFGLRPRIKKKKRKKTATTSEGGSADALIDSGGPSEASNVELSEFLNLYQGYFLSNSITNGGIVLPADSQVPSVISRRDRRRLAPIKYVLDRDAKNVKALLRKVEKFNDMELFVRKEVVFKKLKVFRQQKHFTKKSMYVTDTWGSFAKSELEGRAIVRQQRLDRVDETVLRPKNAMVPHLQNIPIAPATHLERVFKYIRPDAEHGPTDQVKTQFIKAAVSDFEEVIERQRYLKYGKKE